jgi:hypothetical protein
LEPGRTNNDSGVLAQLEPARPVPKLGDLEITCFHIGNLEIMIWRCILLGEDHPLYIYERITTD